MASCVYYDDEEYETTSSESEGEEEINLQPYQFEPEARSLERSESAGSGTEPSREDIPDVLTW